MLDLMFVGVYVRLSELRLPTTVATVLHLIHHQFTITPPLSFLTVQHDMVLLKHTLVFLTVVPP
jgi:hypothetical protein